MYDRRVGSGRMGHRLSISSADGLRGKYAPWVRIDVPFDFAVDNHTSAVRCGIGKLRCCNVHMFCDINSQPLCQPGAESLIDLLASQ